MLLIICGEDNIRSRDYYLALKKKYEKEGVQIYQINVSEFENINRWLSDSLSLFFSKKVFFTENLNKRLSKKTAPSFFSMVEKLAKDRDVEIIDWEDNLSSREIKSVKGAIFKEFKPEKNIFKLLNACYPGNLKNFLHLLYNLPEKTDEAFVFIMLCRHIRNLLITKIKGPPKSLQNWQISKLKIQAKLWNITSLITFYDGLYKIEAGLKTGKNVLSLQKSLELLAGYLL